jgi:type III restriction enzyme
VKLCNVRACRPSAPTASGKTVILTAVIEKILGGDGGISEEVAFEPEPDAVFLWLSDQPELNNQSRNRIYSATSRMRQHDLVIVESDFDAEFFDGGKVFFLNSQKLGKDKLLTRYGDGRIGRYGRQSAIPKYGSLTVST